MRDRLPFENPSWAVPGLLALALLAACDAGETGASDSSSAEVAESASTGVQSTGDARASGPELYVERPPSPCSLVTESVAQDVLNAGSVVAAPGNGAPESSNPRCAYRDGGGLGKSVAIVVVSTPYDVINAAMTAEHLRDLVNQYYAPGNAAYEILGTGPGAQRFVATTDDGVTLFVMTGIGVAGGSFDPNKISAEAAFSISLRDSERTQEERLAQARDLAAAYQVNWEDAAMRR